MYVCMYVKSNLIIIVLISFIHSLILTSNSLSSVYLNLMYCVNFNLVVPARYRSTLMLLPFTSSLPSLQRELTSLIKFAKLVLSN